MTAQLDMFGGTAVDQVQQRFEELLARDEDIFRREMELIERWKSDRNVDINALSGEVRDIISDMREIGYEYDPGNQKWVRR